MNNETNLNPARVLKRVVATLAQERDAERASELAAQRVAEQVASVIDDTTVRYTEVIRDGGFVHGRVRPIIKVGNNW